MSALAPVTTPPGVRVVFSDLDGTILPARAVLPPERNLSALRALGDAGILRVLVTGRDAHSTRRILDAWGARVRELKASEAAAALAVDVTGTQAGSAPATTAAAADEDPALSLLADVPVDYLIFSSGSGTLRVRDWAVIDARTLDPATSALSAHFFASNGLDFFVHHPAPNTHNHYYYDATASFTAQGPSEPASAHVVPPLISASMAAVAAETAVASAGGVPPCAVLAGPSSNPDFVRRLARIREHGHPLLPAAIPTPSTPSSPSRLSTVATSAAAIVASAMAPPLKGLPLTPLLQGSGQLIAVIPPLDEIRALTHSHAPAAAPEPAQLQPLTQPEPLHRAFAASDCPQSLAATLQARLFDHIRTHSAGRTLPFDVKPPPPPHQAQQAPAQDQEEQPFSLVIATSPIDHRSLWLEVQPRGVDKGRAVTAFLASLVSDNSSSPAAAAGNSVNGGGGNGGGGGGGVRLAAVGNDFNDVPLLALGAARGEAFVVADAPPRLRVLLEQEYCPPQHQQGKGGVTIVASCADAGFAEACEIAFPEAFAR